MNKEYDQGGLQTELVHLDKFIIWIVSHVFKSDGHVLIGRCEMGFLYYIFHVS